MSGVRGLFLAWRRLCKERDAAANRADQVEIALDAALREGTATIDEIKAIDAVGARQLLRVTLHRDMPFIEHARRVKALGLPPWDREPQTIGLANRRSE